MDTVACKQPRVRRRVAQRRCASQVRKRASTIRPTAGPARGRYGVKVSAFPNPDMCNFSSAVCGGAIRDMMMGRPRNIFDGFWYEQAGGLIAVIVVPIVLVCICIGICVLCICWKQAVVVVHHQGGKHLPALKHQRRRSACICQHQRIRSRCKECGWASTCARQAHARSAVGRASASSAGGRASACTSSTCTECGGLCPLAPAPKEPMQGVRGGEHLPAPTSGCGMGGWVGYDLVQCIHMK